MYKASQARKVAKYRGFVKSSAPEWHLANISHLNSIRLHLAPALGCYPSPRFRNRIGPAKYGRKYAMDCS